ncbi:MAG: hypothetical protein A3K61_00540 [Thaumarchaeota archaeon RBG_16_49_8]|nr:helix-turn-helix transcriptional regulator [Nitrososphaerota archaeon]OHE55341.1 MAG: hypothetical protein A3K61_00540 [Thaumarchaeota archaeon RBG_16_49_8]
MPQSTLNEEVAKITENYINALTETVNSYSEVKLSLSEIQKEITEINKVFNYLSKKWAFEILVLLYMRILKFNELKNLLIGISSRTLTDRLRMLEAAGFISRNIVNEAPVRIEYSLTEKGRRTAISCYPLIYQSKRNNPLK